MDVRIGQKGLVVKHLQRPWISAKKEAPVNFLKDPSKGTSTLRPASVLVFGLEGRKHACVNLTGVSPQRYADYPHKLSCAFSPSLTLLSVPLAPPQTHLSGKCIVLTELPLAPT
ncbi:hypothetical protein Hanom_Chr05g00450821 [Helianthus anomalus]